MEQWTRNKLRSFTWTTKSPATWQEAFSLPYEADLRSWRRRVELALDSDTEIVVSFVCDQSIGFGHNHARALLCRKLKHVEISKSTVSRLARVIGNRLISGDFSEQFFDQLRLIARKDRSTLLHFCQRALAESQKSYVIELANRALLIPQLHVAAKKSRHAPRKKSVRWVTPALHAAKHIADTAGIEYWKAKRRSAHARGMVWFTDQARRFWNSRGEPYSVALIEQADRTRNEEEGVLIEARRLLGEARQSLRTKG